MVKILTIYRFRFRVVLKYLILNNKKALFLFLFTLSDNEY